MEEIAIDIAETEEIVSETQETPPETEEIVSETQETPTENMETVLETVLENEELIEPIKKKPGRPKGAKNKGPSKPRPKKVVISKAIEYESRDEEPSAPAQPERIWDAQHQPIPTEAKTEMAELMLKLLRGQAIERNQRRDAQRRSWFA